MEELYNTYKDEKITGANGEDNSDTIPLYISKLGFKENNETYTGKVLQDYEQEEELYYILIELMRSPDYLRILTNSSMEQFYKRRNLTYKEKNYK